MPSGGPADPQSWNRYAYVQGDPVNNIDPYGLYMCSEMDKMCLPPCWTDGSCYGESGREGVGGSVIGEGIRGGGGGSGGGVCPAGQSFQADGTCGGGGQATPAPPPGTDPSCWDWGCMPA